MTTTVYFNDRYTASAHAAEPTRKSGLIAATLADHPEVRLADPAAHRDEALVHLAEVHDARYLEAIRTGEPFELAESQGFGWDPGIYTMAVEHAAGQVAAVNEVLTTGARIAGSLSSGQHHARRDEGVGFCTFNGLAASTREAFLLGVERVLVLDFDAHGGGGTRSVTDPERVIQVDVTVSPFDLWEPTTANDHFELAEADDYLSAIDRALHHASGIGAVDLVIYNAGMDPVNARVGAADLAERERRVAEWAAAAEVPLAYLLAGGYLWGGFDWDDIVALHRLTIDTFVN